MADSSHEAGFRKIGRCFDMFNSSSGYFNLILGSYCSELKIHYNFWNDTTTTHWYSIFEITFEISNIINRWPFVPKKNIFFKKSFHFFLFVSWKDRLKSGAVLVAQCDRRRNDNSIELITYKIIVIPVLSQ